MACRSSYPPPSPRDEKNLGQRAGTRGASRRRTSVCTLPCKPICSFRSQDLFLMVAGHTTATHPLPLVFKLESGAQQESLLSPSQSLASQLGTIINSLFYSSIRHTHRLCSAKKPRPPTPQTTKAHSSKGKHCKFQP